MNILVQPSERESRARLMRIECPATTELDFNIFTGMDGLKLVIDGTVIRSGLSPSAAMEALREARRVARCGAHDALAELAATVAKMRTA